MASMQNHVVVDNGIKSFFYVIVFGSSGGSPHKINLCLKYSVSQGCLLKSGLSNFRRERHPVV